MKIEHEKMGRDGTVSSWFAVDTYYYPRNHSGRRSDFRFGIVLHQVRHPLDVISSLETAIPASWWHWQQALTGVSKESEHAAARFWLRWNELCEESGADLVYRIEDIGEVWPQLSRLIFGEERPLPPVRTDYGRLRRRNRKAVTWKDLGPWEEPVRKKAAEYGYAA